MTTAGTGTRSRGLALAAGAVLLLAAWWWLAAEPASPPPATGGADDGAAGRVAAAQVATRSDAAPAANERTAVAAPPASASGGWELTVRVVDAHGQPVGGAFVELAADAASEPFERAQARGDGGWRGVCREALVWVRARHDDVGTSVQVPCTAALAQGPLVLPLLRPVQVRGRVLGRGAVPRADAQVVVLGELAVARAEVGLVAPPLPVHVDADGRFLFEAAVGAKLRLLATDGSQAIVPERTVIAADGLDVLLAVFDAFAVHGVLLDEHGVPVAGTASREGEADGHAGAFDGDVFLRSDLHLERTADAHPSVRVGDGRAAGVGADGSFHLPVPLGPVQVSARFGDLLAPVVEGVLSVERPRLDVVLQLAPNVPSRGVVVDEAGVPVAGAAVTASADDPRFAGVQRHAKADAAGAFVVALPSGSAWRFEAVEGPEVAAAAGASGLRLVRRRAPRRVLFESLGTGGGEAVAAETLPVEVVDAKGEPAVFPWFQWYHVHDDVVLRELMANADPALASLRSSPWRFVAHEAGSMASAHHVFEPGAPLPQRLRLTLQPPTSLVVTVRRAGQPMRGLDLEIDPCGPSGRWTVGTDGVGRAARVSHGPAVLRVLRGAEVLAVRAVELLPGQRMEFSIELGP